MHTTQLPQNWLAFHHGEIADDDVVTFVDPTTHQKYKIPYCVIKALVNNQVRSTLISKIEQMDDPIASIINLIQ